MNGLALQVQEALHRDPHAGDVYVFRGRRGDLLKILWHDGLGMSLSPSGSSADGSSGPRRRMAWCRSRQPSLATCSRGSIGGIRSGPGGLNWPDEAEFLVLAANSACMTTGAYDPIPM